MSDSKTKSKPSNSTPTKRGEGLAEMSCYALDACCGSRMFWFDKHDDRAVFVDIRKESHILNDRTAKGGKRDLEINPDLVADFTNLPFDDEQFYLVVFDPPHLKKLGDNSWLALKYGKLNDNWQEMIADGFAECFRVLRNGGTLIFKWNETDIPLSRVLDLTTEKPMFGHPSGKRAMTHWVTFMKHNDQR